MESASTMIDRRVQKTLQSLHQALIALMLEKGYDAITVQDIIDRANVGRSTFYSHFLGKEQLLQAGLNDLHKTLLADSRAMHAQGVGEKHLPFAFSMKLFEHVHDYLAVYRAMLGEQASAIILNRMQALLADLVRYDIAKRALAAGESAIPPAAVVQFVTGALISIMSWWVDEKQSYTPAQVDQIFRQLTLPGLAFCRE